MESLASGTPVVARSVSALPEVIGTAGVAADGTPVAYAAAVRDLLERPVVERRAAARAQAERFPWSKAVDGFLDAHRLGRAREADPAVA
ncbi:glycosyltransferase [Actinoplanes awajinensis]|uniref:glycosyltransferase n=1 Tax=Actinoplanes awajinensis TaxID=135946 RepID=UPI001E2DA5C9|nr:glycosyltransferase [Actinoplanes awajinensis]